MGSRSARWLAALATVFLCSGAALAAPFVTEHGNNPGFEIIVSVDEPPLFEFGAAGLLSFGQQRIEERTAGIGVDFDQLGTIIIEMEVVTH